MPTTSSILAFALVSALLIISPGPSVTFILGRALANGSRAALNTVFGNAVGLAVQVAAVAFGLGAAVAASASLFSTIRYLGGAYLVWLGVKALRRSGPSDIADEIRQDSNPIEPVRIQLFEGFMVGMLNPKSIVFLAAILPQYANQTSGPVTSQLLVLGVVYVLIALTLDSVWATAAGRARQWFTGSPRREQVIAKSGGFIMIGLGLRLAIFGGPSKWT